MRQLTLSDDGAEEFVAAMLRNDIENLTEELNEVYGKQHPEDRKYCKKMKKNLIKVLSYYSITPYEESRQ